MPPRWRKSLYIEPEIRDRQSAGLIRVQQRLRFRSRVDHMTPSDAFYWETNPKIMSLPIHAHYQATNKLTSRVHDLPGARHACKA